jgi:type IV pilus assembly protein PilQ
VRAALILCLMGSVATAGDLCAPGRPHRGKALDLDVTNAEINDVLRLLADTANINLVVGPTVTGKITLKLKHVAWDALACTIAGVQHLRMTLDDNILLVVAIK